MGKLNVDGTEMHPAETAVISSTDDCSCINALPYIREIFLQPAAYPYSFLIDVIYSANFCYIVQHRIAPFPACYAGSQPLFCNAVRDFSGYLS